MKDMYIDGFEVALKAFDDALDNFARQSRIDSNCNYGWASSSGPMDDYGTYTITRVYPATNGKSYTIARDYPAAGNKTCECGYGDHCGCDSKITSKVAFNDILDDVKQVIFNDPATIVTFSDGSKVCVKACAKDKFNKETGLIYAIIKRLYANDIEQKTGYMRSSGLGEKISKVLAKSTDQKTVERERRRKQKQAKKEAAKKADLANEVSEQAAKEAVEQVYESECDKIIDQN